MSSENLREWIARFLWDYAMGEYNAENMNLEEQMNFKAGKILSRLRSQIEQMELRFPNEGMVQRLVSPVPLMSPYHGSVIEAYRLAQQDLLEDILSKLQ